MSEHSERPFAFEDLPLNGDGKRVEPESWGPIYTKPAKPGKIRHVEPATNAASGQPYEFSAARHRAKLKSEFAAQANADKRSWANGTATLNRRGFSGKIVDAYKQAMIEKCARLAIVKASKPHYIYRNNTWKLAA
jgi:hypothetical protein